MFEHCFMNGCQTFFTISSLISSRRTTIAAAAARTKTVRRHCQQRQLQGRRNRQRQQLHQPLTTAAKCASWRYVLASHWCLADMRGSVNLVLCACHIWMRDALFVVRILPWQCAFFLYGRLCHSTLATFTLIIATFVLCRYFV